MVASTAFVQYSIRPEFDVAIPFVNTAENLNVVGTQIRKTFILATGLKTEQVILFPKCLQHMEIIFLTF